MFKQAVSAILVIAARQLFQLAASLRPQVESSITLIEDVRDGDTSVTLSANPPAALERVKLQSALEIALPKVDRVEGNVVHLAYPLTCKGGFAKGSKVGLR